jgi:hypothetical protein
MKEVFHTGYLYRETEFLAVKYSQILVVLIASIFLLGVTSAYVTDGSSTPGVQCNDGNDNDGDGQIDGEDSGCVQPYYADDSEGDIWDTDMTALVVGGAGNFNDLSVDFSVFFEGTVHRGSRSAQDQVNTGQNILNVTHIDDIYSESESFGGGRLEWTGSSSEYSFSSFPQGTVVNPDGENRAVDTPNPYGSGEWSQGGQVIGSAQNCGDGYENDGVSRSGDDAGTSGSETPCKLDYGRVDEKYFVKSPAEGGHQDSTQTSNNGLWCRSDDMDSSGNTLSYSCENGDDAQCNSGDGSPSGCSAGDCEETGENGECTNKFTGSLDDNAGGTWDDSFSSDEGTEYWYDSGEFVIKDSCSRTGSWSETGNGGDSCSFKATSVYNSGNECTGDDPDCEPEPATCDLRNPTECPGGDDTTIEGDYRDWTQANSKNCNDYNVVDGGGDLGGSASDQVGEEYSDKPDNDPAATYTDFTAYGSNDWNKVWCGFDYTITIDGDGPNGYGDGWVVVHDGSIVAMESPDGGDKVGRYYASRSNSGSAFRWLDESQLESRIDTSCSGSTTCLKYIDMYTTPGSGNRGSPEWTSVSDSNVEVDAQTAYPDDSYSSCKNMNRIWREEHGLGDSNSLVQCDTSENRNNGGNLISPSNDGVGGDETNEFWVYMEGPEVNEEQFDDNPGHYQGSVDNFNDCVLRGQEVSEGYVGNVAPQSSTDQYEKGGNSPDWEVCLNLGEFGDSDPGDDMGGDNYCMDQQGVIDNEAYENGNCNDPQDAGGEWYDLDSETAQEYLRNNGNDLIQNGDSSDPRNIAYYWTENVNPPQDSEYNPEGDRSGTAMEDDCGNPRFDSLNCNDPVTDTNREATFFSFFEEGKREEDYNPQGDPTGENKLDGFTGYMNQLQDRSNQLEPGMETDTYDPSDQEFHQNSVGGDDADAWAITEELTWSIDTTGVPYPPYSTYYRDQSDQRGNTDASSVDKRAKAFANSFAAVATSPFPGQENAQVGVGDGVWIDPDAIIDNTDKVKLTPDGSGWRSAFSSSDVTGTNVGFKIDLTGPDSGLGIDVSPFSGENPECLNRNSEGGCRVRADDVYWERNDAGNIESEFEKNVCGDDRLEFFIEEIGESTNTERYDGEYACSDSLNSCYDSSNPVGERVVDQGSYSNTDEPGEDVGRFKEDKEICQKIDSQDDFAIWYDQDYRESFCNANTLYGNEGVRWFDEEYVSNYPQAVKWGIDDSWNSHMNQRGHESYDSQPGTTGPGITPVPTGNQFDVTATKGFCGGDDGSEYLATQECNTQYCETDRTVQGVGKTPGSCVLSRSENTQYSTNVDRRTVFEPGDEVTIQEVSGQPTIACFNGAWFSDWPINFNQEEIDVPLGETRTVTFEVINVRGTEQTFDVTMEEDSDNPSADQFASFVEKEGREFRTTLEPEGSKTFSIELRGGNLDLNDDDLTVRADAVNSQQFGSDSVSVSVVEAGSSTGRQGTEEVPGIQALQLVALFVSATLIFVVHGRS